VNRTYEVRLDSEALALVEFRYPPHKAGPDRHVHHHHTDGFYVLEGELTVEVAGRTLQLGPGSFVSAAPDVVHTFRNDSDGETRFLNLHAPSMGFPAYLEGTNPDFDQHEPPDD
jgi:quercetin dioxygenase-like cupin family protein